LKKFDLIRFPLLICIVFTLATEFGKAHSDKHIDSLFNQLRKVDDITRIDLFNEIARDIISSDIAVFETSDLNPNVMLEMGVALTWDVRVLPIKKEGQPKPPSDISGQTYADYRDSAAGLQIRIIRTEPPPHLSQ
jgi:predicted nucleotide-binding protein